MAKQLVYIRQPDLWEKLTRQQWIDKINQYFDEAESAGANGSVTMQMDLFHGFYEGDLGRVDLEFYHET